MEEPCQDETEEEEQAKRSKEQDDVTRNRHRVILVPWIPATSNEESRIVVESAVEDECSLQLLAQTKASPGWWTGVTKLIFRAEPKLPEPKHRNEGLDDDDDDDDATTCLIPELFNDEICDYWKQLTEVVVEPGVRVLGNSFLAFANAPNLTSVTLPEGLESIGANFCFDAASLTTLALPSTVRGVGDSFLSGCKQLTQLDLCAGGEGDNPPIPSLTSVGEAFLFQCRLLECITLPDSLTSVGDFFMNGCDEIREIALPPALASMGDYLLEGCFQLRKVEFLLRSSNLRGNVHTQLTAIGHNFCNDCINLELVLNIPDSVTSIGKYFCADSGELLTTLALPDALTSIADGPQFLESVGCSGEIQVPSHLLPQPGDDDALIAAADSSGTEPSAELLRLLRHTLADVAAKRGWNLVQKNSEQK